MRSYFCDYPDNSRSAILRAAIMVAHSDGDWHNLERDRLEIKYRDLCRMLDADLDDDLLLKELDTITQDVPDEIDQLDSDEEREAYWKKCLAPIVSRDIQQVTVMAAVRIASGDGEIDPTEAAGLRRLCKECDTDLREALEHCGS